MSAKKNIEKKYIYFKFIGERKIQVTKEQWESEWKRWYDKKIRASNKDGY